MQVVYSLFDTYNNAQQAVAELIDQNIPSKEISIITQETTLPSEPVAQENLDDGAAAGAGTGAIIGGLTGLLVGVGAITIPGFGPLLAVGPLLTTISAIAAGTGIGAVGGGLIGALVDWGIPDDVASTYSDAISDGQILIAVNSKEEHIEAIETVMRNNRGHDMNVYQFQGQTTQAHIR